MPVSEHCLECEFFVQCQAQRKSHFTTLGISHQYNGSTFFSHVNGLTGGYLHSCYLNHQIYPLSVGKFCHSFQHIFFFRIDDTSRSQFQCLVQTFLHYIDYINLRHTFCLQSHHGYQSDTAGTENKGCLSGMCIPLIGCMKAYSQGFDQCTFQSRDIFGQFEAKIGFVSYIFLKHAIYRRSSKEHHIGT